ncbi:hypothetical protein LOTGIDRAFT_173845 [Lottia gigantea]|uniref:Uncharacterized protein n=1 Tax=Lottia gigantea TaxID=225164 RepID=V4APM2_LOTGI|nr:hypothetical protein LOTGIDRAFT_173845 [Lottia gigantea]ESO99152.1 hypothetical protein LOTGIDRAFT_173845 [Lottia gigantea]
MPVDNFLNMNLSAGEKASEGNVLCMEPRLPENSAKQAKKPRINNESKILDVVTPENRSSAVPKDCEIDGDIGYSSHGTQEDSQKSNLSLKITEWQGREHDEQDDFMHPDNDLDDLLYHFNNFFQEKLENELTTFQESMRNMLTEQQIHVRQIVHNSSVPQNLLDSPLTNMDTSELDHCNSNHSSPNEHEAVHASSQVQEASGTNELLTELLSLSCAVTTLLHQPKYRI